MTIDGPYAKQEYARSYKNQERAGEQNANININILFPTIIKGENPIE